MALKSAWAYHNAGRTLKKDIEIVQRLEDEKNEKRLRELPNIIKNRKAKSDKRAELLGQLFDSLKVGDSLITLGFPNIVIEKKNKKSCVSTLGTKYTKNEIINGL